MSEGIVFATIENLDSIMDNVHMPAEKVKHRLLTRFNDSAYKSICPFCGEGGLWIQRDEKNGYKLQHEDRCVFCGRAVIYTDIEEAFLIVYKDETTTITNSEAGDQNKKDS